MSQHPVHEWPNSTVRAASVRTSFPRNGSTRARRRVVRSSPVVIGMLAIATLLAPGSAAIAAPALTAPTSMAALGDSITRASSADGTSGDNLANNWSTGSTASVASHRSRIVAATGVTPTVYNLAQGGTETSALRAQAAGAVSRGVQYVTILSGANNVCHASTLAGLPTVANVRADFVATFQTLNAGLPEAKIFVASIPSLMSMYLAARDSFQARMIWAAVGVCPVMLGNPTDQSSAAQSRRAAVEQRVDEMNAAIASACAAASNCTTDDNAVNEMPITLQLISTRDFFHPSVAGQAQLAAVTWAKALSKGVFNAAPAKPPVLTTVDNTSSALQWSGTWGETRSAADNGGSVSYLTSMPAGYTLTFTGTKISIEARKTPTSGISEVRIDGVLRARVDAYSATTLHRQVVFASGTLSAGTHTLKVTTTQDKSAQSSGHNLILDALLVQSAG